MTGFLLDTNTVSYLVDRNAVLHPPVSARYRSLSPGADLRVSILTLYETSFVAARVPTFADLISYFERTFAVTPLPVEGADHFGRLKAGLAARWGTSPRSLRSHNVDLMVAATALALDLVLVKNDAIFSELAAIDPRLTVEDWTT